MQCSDPEEASTEAQEPGVLHNALWSWRHGVQEGTVRFRSNYEFDTSLNLQAKQEETQQHRRLSNNKQMASSK